MRRHTQPAGGTCEVSSGPWHSVIYGEQSLEGSSLLNDMRSVVGSSVIIQSSTLGFCADRARCTAGRGQLESDVTTAACWLPLRRRSLFRSGRRPSRSPARTSDHSTLRHRYDPRRTSAESNKEQTRVDLSSCLSSITHVSLSCQYKK